MGTIVNLQKASHAARAPAPDMNATTLEESANTDALTRLSELLADDLIATNQIILSGIESHVPLIPELAAHIVASGGKRLRPLLVLAASRLCGYQGERHCRMAAMIEFIHTATLLHDDVVDVSDLRRGKPSANALFGNQAAILVGDYLYSRAFQMVVEDGSIEILRILSNASSIIAEGEVMQLSAKNDCATGEQAYLEIIRAKTAELFAAACRIGGVLGVRPAAEDEALRTYGLNLGIAFQIIDDVLDYSAEQGRLGKTIGDDFREGKITLPVILSLHRSSETERAFWHRVMNNQNQQEGDLHFAQEMMRRHGVMADCHERAKHYATIARDALSLFPTGTIKDALIGVADFAVSRGF